MLLMKMVLAMAQSRLLQLQTEVTLELPPRGEPMRDHLDKHQQVAILILLI